MGGGSRGRPDVAPIVAHFGCSVNEPRRTAPCTYEAPNPAHPRLARIVGARRIGFCLLCHVGDHFGGYILHNAPRSVLVMDMMGCAIALNAHPGWVVSRPDH